jgi:hypothetical protein
MGKHVGNLEGELLAETWAEWLLGGGGGAGRR